MTDPNGWGERIPAPPPVAPPTPPQTGLTAEVMTKLEAGRPLEPRARITNATTFVLLGLALLVGTFSAGAWVGRRNAPATSSTATTANAAFAANAANGATVTGASGRTRGSGANGFGGASGATGGTGAAAAFPGAAGAGGGTVGTVKLVDGTNVYLATTSGTVVKVTTSPQSQITVSTQGTVADLAVGETVVVQGDTGADGTIAATVIRSGTGGGFGGGRTGGGTGGGAAGAASGATGR